MTEREFYNLYDKIRDVLYGFKSYHCWYFCCNEEYYGDSMSFEVHVNSDQGYGDEWIENWGIRADGSIWSESETYKDFTDFEQNWG